MITAWVAGYLLAGFGFVNKDLAEPVYNRPSYVRSAKGRWLVRAFWPIVSIALLWQHSRWKSGELKHEYIGGQFIPSWFLFAGIGAIGTLIGNWISG